MGSANQCAHLLSGHSSCGLDYHVCGSFNCFGYNSGLKQSIHLFEAHISDVNCRYPFELKYKIYYTI